MADDPKKTTKEPANPDSKLTWAEMVKKAVTSAQEMAKVLEPLGKVNRDDANHEQKPIQDKAGLTAQTARAVKAQYRQLQKKNGGNYELGDATAKKAHTLRSLLEKAHTLAGELATDIQSCYTTEQRMTADFAKNNKAKIQKEKDKAKAAKERAAKREADLEAQLKAS